MTSDTNPAGMPSIPFGETSIYHCPRCGKPATSPLTCARCADEQFGAELPAADLKVKTTFAGRCWKCGTIAQGPEPWDAVECAQCRAYVNPTERQAIALERIAAALEKLTGETFEYTKAYFASRERP